MLTRLSIFMIVILTAACTPSSQYAWVDIRTPSRDDATVDLEFCRDYAARQYQVGNPAGEDYLNNQEERMGNGEWRPDRSPDSMVNVNALPRHDIPVDYTGYPGELDYYPHYLDDILEKCMRDRGWEYSEVKDNQ